jgi:hypothetical protein
MVHGESRQPLQLPQWSADLQAATNKSDLIAEDPEWVQCLREASGEVMTAAPAACSHTLSQPTREPAAAVAANK